MGKAEFGKHMTAFLRQLGNKTSHVLQICQKETKLSLTKQPRQNHGLIREAVTGKVQTVTVFMVHWSCARKKYKNELMFEENGLMTINMYCFHCE